MRFYGLLLVVVISGCSGDDDAGEPVDSGLGDAGRGDAGDGRRDGGPPDAMPGEDGGPERDTGTIDIDGGDDAVDLRIRIHGLETHDGRPLRLRVENRAIVPLPPPMFYVQEIAGGDVEILVPDGMPRDVFGVFVHFYVDQDTDGTCTDPEPAWNAFVSNTFEDGEQVADIDVADPTTTPEMCAMALTPG